MIFFVVILIKLVVSNGFLYSYFLNRILRDLYLNYYENNENNDSENYKITDKYKNRIKILFFEFIYVYIYIPLYVYMCICLCVYMYICIYTYM